MAAGPCPLTLTAVSRPVVDEERDRCTASASTPNTPFGRGADDQANDQTAVQNGGYACAATTGSATLRDEVLK
jgi:hypothetical protein